MRKRTLIEFISLPMKMASVSKKRKIDSENRMFHESWTEDYFFILPDRSNSRPTCIICQETISVIKSGNVKRHFETKHKEYDTKYPPKSAVRTSKIAALKASFHSSTLILTKSMNLSENATEASMRIVWILGRHKKSFRDAEVVKECMIAASSVLFADSKSVETVKQVPLSDSTAMRRSDDLAENVFDQLILAVQKADSFALACDESTDKTDLSQMCVCVRFFDGTQFIEDFLALLTLSKQTRGEDVFSVLTHFMQHNNLDVTKMISLTTDGAPAMIGREKGLASRMKALQPKLLSYHCIIHQSVLCCKLSDDFANVMLLMMKLVNFIRSNSSLQHRLFRSFLDESSAQYGDLLLHNDVRWLSKGRVLERFWSIRGEVLQFLGSLKAKKATDFVDFITDVAKMTTVAFLVDITGYLNELNLQLQGRNKTVIDLQQKCKSFQAKLELFHRDIEAAHLLHFPTLKSILTPGCTVDCLSDFGAFINKLQQEFAARFADFADLADVFLFVAGPFSMIPDGEWTAKAEASFPNINQAALQLEMTDLQADDVLKLKFQEVNNVEFWSNMIPVEKYPTLRKLGVHVLTLFGSTYTCESAFSTMNVIKDKHRSVLTDEHLQNSMRIALTSYQPKYKDIMKHKSQFHVSH